MYEEWGRQGPVIYLGMGDAAGCMLLDRERVVSVAMYGSGRGSACVKESILAAREGCVDDVGTGRSGEWKVDGKGWEGKSKGAVKREGGWIADGVQWDVALCVIQARGRHRVIITTAVTPDGHVRVDDQRRALSSHRFTVSGKTPRALFCQGPGAQAAWAREMKAGLGGETGAVPMFACCSE